MREQGHNPSINPTGAMSSVDRVRADLEKIGFYDEHIYPANIGVDNGSQSRRPANLPTTPAPMPPKP
jgi:hypothetical protein